jgi:hypothetical protein
MGSHPVNLAIRFLLELSALAALSSWAWHLTHNWPRFVFALGLPILAAAIWGTFAVPDDPSRSGKAPIVVSGVVRLLIEFALFGGAAVALYSLGWTRLGLGLILTTTLHYLVSYDRILWLIRR